MFPDFQQKKLKIKRSSLILNKQKDQSQQKEYNRTQTAFQPSRKHLKIYKNPNQIFQTTFNETKPFRKTIYNQSGNKQAGFKVLIANQRKSLKRLSKAHQKTIFYYFIKNEGNNSKRVEQILSLRGCWQKSLSKSNQSQINFYWNMSGINNSNNKFEFSLFSRISGSYQLTDKARLYNNIVRYCQKNKISNELFLPITFCFTSKQTNSQLEENIDQFLDYFCYIKDHTNLTNSWIFKPTNLNRGRQIFLFNSLQKLYELIFVGQVPIQRLKEEQKSTNKFMMSNKYKKYKSTHELQKKSLTKYVSKKQQSEIPSLQLLKQNSIFRRKKNILNQNQNHHILFEQPKNQQNTFKLLKNNPFNHKMRKTLQIQSVKKNHVAPYLKSSKLKTEIFSQFQQFSQQNHKKQINSKINKNNRKQQKSNKPDHQNKLQDQIQLRQKITKAIKQLSQGRSSVYSQNTKKQIVIQKYIQNPYLIKENKFDIRIWVLVDQQMNVYVFKSGYLRFSSHKYKLDDKSIQNNFIHLTNHAVQKYSDKYQKEVNIVSMLTLKQHLQKVYKSQTQNSQKKYEQIWNEIERIIIISLEATIGQFYKKDHNQNKYTFGCQFQIFGYDFLLDRELKVRLIEANCNPSITQDNKYLQQAVPRMLNDAFKLTVDKDFVPIKISKSSFYMPGFSSENMWKRIGKICQTNIRDIKYSFQ